MELLVYDELLFRIGKLQSETFIGFLTSKSRSTTLGTDQPDLSDSFIFVIWVGLLGVDFACKGPVLA